MDHANQQRKVLTNIERPLDLNSTNHNEIIKVYLTLKQPCRNNVKEAWLAGSPASH